MKRFIVFIIVLPVLLISVHPVKADLYSGSISYSDGIDAYSGWESSLTSLSWDVELNSDQSWHYSYTFVVPTKAISHFILEVSDNFSPNDFLGFSNPPVLASVMSTSGSWSVYEPDTYNSTSNGNSNPGIPGDIYGIKFELSGSDSTTWHFEFDSTKRPMWGDFYAVDGKSPGDIAYAYNKGFGIDVSMDDGMHIAVPDTLPRVPVPGAILLGMLGMGMAGIKLRKNV